MNESESRAAFTAWQHAPGIAQVKETAIGDAGVVSLTGVAYRGTVRVELVARAYNPLHDAGTAETPRVRTASMRATVSAPHTDRPRPGPLIPLRPAEGPRSRYTR